MGKLNKILNDDYRDKNWFFRNYFFIGTAAVILTCSLLFIFGGYSWNPIVYGSHGWTEGLYFNPLFYGFLNSFGHANLQHMLLNMLCFLIAGLYLERKTGTLSLLLLIIAFAFLSTGITAANYFSVSSIGYSGVNYALYFYIIADFIFMLFHKTERKILNTILGIIILALIYLAMCFSGGTSKFSFELYPYDLFNNMGHTGGAFAGLVVGLIVQITKLKSKQVGKAK